LNKIILMGRLTADPEMKFTTTNIPVCRFSIAVNRAYSKEGEEKQADFFKVVAWRKTGEIANQYFRKGSPILLEGTLQNNNYEDNQGVRHYSMEVIAEKIYFVGGKKQEQAGQIAPIAEQTAPMVPPEEDDDLPF
jgi:single-strand DNA-binding protein